MAARRLARVCVTVGTVGTAVVVGHKLVAHDSPVSVAILRHRNFLSH